MPSPKTLGWLNRTVHAEIQSPVHRYGLVSGAVQLINWGVMYYSFGILLPDIHSETGLSLALLGSAPTLAALSGSVAAIALGHYWQVGNAGTSFFAGIGLGALAMALWSVSSEAWHFLLVAIVLGIGQALCLYDASFMMVHRHIRNPELRTGVLMRITLLGGLASAVFVPLAGGLASIYSWRSTMLILAGVLLVAALPLARRLAPFEETGSPLPKRTRLNTGPPIGTFDLGSWTFTVGLASAALATILPVSLLDLGFCGSVVVALVALLGITQLAGRLLLMPLAQRFGTRPLLSTTSLAIGTGILALAFLPPQITWLSIMTTGTALGMSALLRPVVLERVAGNSRVFAQMNGVQNTIGQAARAAGPVSAGLAFDLGGSGRAPLVLIGSCAMIAGLVLVLRSPLIRHRRQQRS